jgi:predicted nucleotidyltransferase
MEGYGLSDVRLFGSVAQGRADDKSDVDFLVKDSLSFKGSLLAFSHLIEQLKTLLKRDVDLVFEDQIKPNLKPFIMSQKMLPVC